MDTNYLLFRRNTKIWLLSGLIGLASPFASAFVGSNASAVAQQLFEKGAFSDYSPNVENGKYMFAASGCAVCHASPNDPDVLSGGLKMETAIGEFYTPNISPSAQGIGGWSKAEFLNAVMRGVSPDGDHYYPTFPYTSYAGLKPQDVLDIQAYIATLPKSDNSPQAHKIGFPYNFQTTISLWKMSNEPTAAFVPGDNSPEARGKYLVEAAGHCNECHTPRDLTFNLEESQRFTGAKGLTGAFAPAITAEALSSVSATHFTENILGGAQKISGSAIADPMMFHLAKQLGTLSKEDRNAIYTYLTGKTPPAPKKQNFAQAACGVDEEVSLTDAGGDDALARKVDDFMGKYCRNCHGPGERAQGSYPAGDLTSIARDPVFVTPGNPEKSILYQSVAASRMPLGKMPSSEEIKILADWITSLGTQAAPAASLKASKPARNRDFVKREQIVRAALADLSKLDEQDRRHMRYFDLRSQYNVVHGCETAEQAQKRLKFYRGAFLKLLNSLSYGPRLLAPDPVEGTDGLLLRVDLRDLKWSEEDYNALVKDYIYGVAPDSDNELLSLALGTQTKLPIMRADWFMSNASKPKMYAKLLKLPDHIKTLETRLGIDAKRNIEDRRILRAGFFQGASAVSDHNRLLERHDMPLGGYYWKSYDFAGDVRHQNLKQFPHGPRNLGQLPLNFDPFEHDGGEMIFSLPNGMQAYYLSDGKGNAIQEGPTSVVSFRSRPIGKGITIVNGRSCFSCHADGIISKRDTMRAHIETSSLFSLDQRDFLLGMYVTQDELNRSYDQDRVRFMRALTDLGVSEKTPNGVERSMSSPDGTSEIITWYADLYEADMDFDAIAGEFDMTPDEFKDAIMRISDGETLRIALDWMRRLDAGLKVPRIELESHYAYMLGFLKQLKPLEAYQVANYKAEPTPIQREEYQQSLGTDYKVQRPDIKVLSEADNKTEDGKNSKLRLALHVPSTRVKVDDLLAFKLTANRACELQLFYVQEDGKVLEFPSAIVGDPHIIAGKAKQVPDPNSEHQARFSEPASVETLVAYCREGGLGNRRLSADDAYKLVQKNGPGAGAKALTFELVKRTKETKGKEAVHMVQFEVMP
nr:c-type cytochrome [uncultured Cohaesibacter sp.]